MYQALYRKYRPQTFDEVVGQQGVTQTLKTQLQTGKLSHAYLFTGSRGTGKTSCAKILAKAVNCEHPVGGNPCNRCAACRAIDSGSCMDVLEIDAASNNGVDSVRALRDDAVFTPAEVRKRVYIIDEVHMLSMAAFNALLKTIEEPPPHLLFILATTELHKVPATILSRCQRFSFRRLVPEDVAARINACAYQEGIEIDAQAIALLSRLADGSLRDGMSLLDQCASSSEGAVTLDTVYRCLGLAGERNTAQMLAAVAGHDTAALLQQFSQLYAAGKDLAAMLDELTALARDLLVLKTAPKAGAGLISSVCTQQELDALLPRFTGAELLRITALLQQTAASLSRTSNSRIEAELCLMQLCDPALSQDVQALNARLSRVEETLAAGVLPVQAAQPAGAQNDDLPPFPGDDDAPPDPDGAPPAAAPKPAPAQDAGPVGFWAELVGKIRGELKPQMLCFFSAAPDAPLRGRLQGDMLFVEASNPFAKGMVDKPEVTELLRRKASALLGRPVGVKFVLQGKGIVHDDDRLDELLQFGKSHGDIISIQE